MEQETLITNIKDYRSSQYATAIATAVARKPCLYKKDGCKWQVPKNNQISITTRRPSCT